MRVVMFAPRPGYAWKQFNSALPSRSEKNGAMMQCADPVAGSSGMPDPGAKKRDTTSNFPPCHPAPGAAQYATPVAGLWLCGAGAHPGGGVMGHAGRNAARALLEAGA